MNKRRRGFFRQFILILFCSFFTLGTVLGQGVLVSEQKRPVRIPRVIPLPDPVETLSYRIKSLEINADLKGEVAEVNISQTFENVGKGTIEASFVFPVPYDGAINQMTLLVNGKEFPAKLLDAKEARSAYEKIVRENRDPALLEWIGTGMFQTSVFPIPAGESRTVSIQYTQLLRTNSGLTEFLFPLRCAQYTSQPVETLKIDVQITGDTELKNIYCPTYSIQTEKREDKSAKVSFSATGVVPDKDFRLFFDSDDQSLSAKFQSYRPDVQEDGYFMLLASPRFTPSEGAETTAKTVILVLDQSGSMSGEKIRQARDSLKFVLNNLREGDKFNIILYESKVQSFAPELQVLNAETRHKALAFADSVRAKGGTNIEAALQTVFEQLPKEEDRPTYVFFLTDGCPTVGECNEMKLADLARQKNSVKARIFTFGVGYDVNSRLLDRFARDNRGVAEYVTPDENIEESISRLYDRISSPVLTDVQFEFVLKNSSDTSYFTNSVYPNETMDLFSGEQLVIVGRYSKPGDVTAKVKGKNKGENVEFSFDGTLVEKSEDSTFGFIEQLWAVRRIGEIIDLLDLNGTNKELLDELVRLSTKHGILTPYTSFLADDQVALTNVADNVVRTRDESGILLSQTSNSSGFYQRGLKQSMKNANSLDISKSNEKSLAMSGGGGETLEKRARSRRGSFMGFSARADMAPMAAPAGDLAGEAVSGQSLRDTDNAEEGDVSSSGEIRNINGRTFFRKTNGWVDSSITGEQLEKQKPILIRQFSPEYFALIEQYGEAISAYLTFTESVQLNFQGQVYQIDP